MLRIIFGYELDQEKARYGLGYKLSLTRNTDNSVLDEADATNNDKINIIGFEWYVPHYTPSMKQRKILSKQILGKLATALQDVERSSFTKSVRTRNLKIFDLRTQGGLNVPVSPIVGF